MASLSPPKHPIPAILMTVSMLIWAHLACDFFFFILSLHSAVSCCTSLRCVLSTVPALVPFSFISSTAAV